MLIAYVTRFMPTGLRYNTSSMLQIHKELEESAAMSGASWSTTFRRVILPLLKPGLLAGWIYVTISRFASCRRQSFSTVPTPRSFPSPSGSCGKTASTGELSALGVMFITALFFLVLIAQWLGRRYGVKDY